MNTTATTPTRGNGLPAFRPKLIFYHASPRGTGCAAQFEVHPAHEDTDGSIFVSLANQMTIGNRMGPNPTYPRFDWENKICLKLDFNDLCQILQVLRGECESVGDGKGLYHQTSSATTKISFRHFVDPVSGYSLEVYRTMRNGGEESHVHMVFNPAEAMGLCEAIAGSMAVICFGIPVVLPHDTSAYEAREKGVRNAVAA